MTTTTTTSGNGAAANPAPAVDVEAARAKVGHIRDALNAYLAEREDTVWVTLAALVSQQHSVLVGPPGTAKSLVSEAVMQCIDGGVYVRRLLHKAMTPDELFGGLDLRRFQKEGIVTRVFSGSIVEAHGFFADETFKSNALLLNSLLTALEERIYIDQAGRVELPLRCAFGASNEFPQDESLGALYDRFLFRHVQTYIQNDSTWEDLVLRTANKTDDGRKFTPPCKLSLAEWDAIKADVERVTVSPEIVKALRSVRAKLAAEGMVMSDRRAVKIASKALKAAAWLDGESAVTIDHLQILKFCAWDTPDEREKVLVVLRTIERSEAAKAIEGIDALIRQAHVLTADPVKREGEALKLCAAMKRLGQDLADRIRSGEFGKRGTDKVRRRQVEMGQLHTKLRNELMGALSV
jgi:MoxR-like ATPase